VPRCVAGRTSGLTSPRCEFAWMNDHSHNASHAQSRHLSRGVCAPLRAALRDSTTGPQIEVSGHVRCSWPHRVTLTRLPGDDVAVYIATTKVHASGAAYGAAPSTAKMRCVAYLSPTAMASL
jgi:hypothetical protein